MLLSALFEMEIIENGLQATYINTHMSHTHSYIYVYCGS